MYGRTREERLSEAVEHICCTLFPHEKCATYAHQGENEEGTDLFNPLENKGLHLVIGSGGGGNRTSPLTSIESNTYDKKPERIRANTKQNNTLADSLSSTGKQTQTPSEHPNDISLHEKCVTCVHQTEAVFPDDLREVIDAWGYLPDAIKTGIMAMVRASGQGHEQ